MAGRAARGGSLLGAAFAPATNASATDRCMDDFGKVVATVDEAVSVVKDGMTLMLGGFISAGFPANLLRALGRRPVRGLTAICTNVGPGDDIDRLVASGHIRKVITSFGIRPQAWLRGALEEQWRAGEVEIELVPQGTLAERIRAGGAGIPAFYAPTGAGTPHVDGKETREIDGVACVLETGLVADVALIRAWRADAWGNLVYHGAGRNFNVPMATAARTVVVEAEQVVAVGELSPNEVETPGVYVRRIVQATGATDLRRRWPNV